MNRQRITLNWLATVAATALLTAPSTANGQVGVLSVEGECPGELTVRITDGRPDRGYFLAFGLRKGTFRIPNNFPCAGLILGIQGRVTFVDIFGTDSNGDGMISRTAPRLACGHFLQAMNNCELTNVVQIP